MSVGCPLCGRERSMCECTPSDYAMDALQDEFREHQKLLKELVDLAARILQHLEKHLSIKKK